MDSDDEYDRNPYRFRTGNASDEEEFDEDEYNEMDEKDDSATRYPWLKSSKPSWMRQEVDVNEEEEDDGDDEDEEDNEKEVKVEGNENRREA